jgi:hypothetical protein
MIRVRSWMRTLKNFQMVASILASKTFPQQCATQTPPFRCSTTASHSASKSSHYSCQQTSPKTSLPSCKICLRPCRSRRSLQVPSITRNSFRRLRSAMRCSIMMSTRMRMSLSLGFWMRCTSTCRRQDWIVLWLSYSEVRSSRHLRVSTASQPQNAASNSIISPWTWKKIQV